VNGGQAPYPFPRSCGWRIRSFDGQTLVSTSGLPQATALARYVLDSGCGIITNSPPTRPNATNGHLDVSIQRAALTE
jgi:hypothetical protein